MTMKFKPFEPFEIPETLRVEMSFDVRLDYEGDVVVTDAEGVIHVFSPEQWKILTERVQVEEEPEPWEKVRGMLIRFGFITRNDAHGGSLARLDQHDFEKMADVLGLKSPGA